MGDVEGHAEADSNPRYPRRERRASLYYQPGSASLATEGKDPEVVSEPRSVQEAFNQPDAVHWKEAMNSELASLNQHRTWIVMKRPSGTKFVRERL